jgi:hypothetical protein
MIIAPLQDLGGATIVLDQFKPQTISDATAKDGTEVDRTSYPHQSGLLIANVAFTTASGASGAKNTVLLELEHGDSSGSYETTAYDSYSYEFTWAADGANSGTLVLPLDLKNAKRYIMGRLTMTESGTVTISSQSASLCLVLGGGENLPHSDYVASGYKDTTEPSA